MALQSSGQIKLSEIATEFGGTAPHSMSEYYAGGSNVPSGTGSIPSSGEIQLAADFYGTSAAVVALNATITIGTRTEKNQATRFGFLSNSNVQEGSTYGSISSSTFTATGSSNTVTIVQAAYLESVNSLNDVYRLTFTGIAGDVYTHPHPQFSHVLIGNYQINYSDFSIAFNTNGFTNFNYDLGSNTNTNEMGTSGTQTFKILL